MLLLLTACRTPSDSAAKDDSHAADDTGPADTGFLQGFVPKNVVIVHVDTMRWDHLPWYGYERDTFPRLSARSGWVRWERMYSTSGWTAPSTASVLTGKDVYHHGVRIVTLGLSDTVVGPTLATWWRDHGYATGFVSGNELFDIPSGLTDGNDAVEVLDKEPLNAVGNVDAAFLVLDALAPGTPFLLHLQPFDPHAPWHPGAAYLGTWANVDDVPFDLESTRDAQRAALTEALQAGSASDVAAIEQAVVDLYDEELLGVDAAVDALIQGLDDRGLLANTLVVLTADHGETLFDRGESFGHGDSLYQELNRLPLLFYNPALADASVDDCVGWNVDLHPTLLTAAGLPLPDDLDGRPLQDGCRDFTTASLYRETDDGASLEMRQMSAQDAHFAVIRRCGLEELAFDLDRDPITQHPLDDPSSPDITTLTAAIDDAIVAAQGTWPELDCPAE